MNISEIKQVLKAAVLASDSVLIEGVHGIGKSEGAEQFSNEEGYHLETLFLSHQEVGDVIGIPHKMEKDETVITTWSMPIWLQRMHQAAAKGIPCVLFLDELNRAQIDVRQSCMQLVLEGRIHEHELPVVNGQRTLVVAAMNPADDYQVEELDQALVDRFLKVTADVDYKSWASWARENKVNNVVRDFLSEFPDRLWWQPADGEIGATPRSWTKLGCYLDNVKAIPEEILFQIMKGKIGSEIGSQFYTYFKNYIDVVKIDDIVKLVEDNKDNVKDIDELAEMISELMGKTEAIQKSDMAHQLADRFGDCDEMLPFLAYLYSLHTEISVGFLKSYKKDESEKYRKLAQVDAKLNNKKLFKRIVQAADKTD